MIALIPLVLSLAAGGDAGCAGVSSALSSVRVEYDSRTSAVGRMSALIFAPSGSGELSAIDADSGDELWRFIAPEASVATAYTDLMTDIAVLRFDANGDGVIDAAGGDRVWLYFGLKRAGAYYYALDVSRRTPRVLWSASATDLEGLTDAWSAPTVARVRVAGASQNGEHFVVIVGGGYTRDAAAAGNHVFMLDASNGHLLWSAGIDASNDLVLAHMTHGIAARVATLDVDGDGFADRLYTADVGGRIWRFDIWNGRARDQLVTGGMFASLGTAEPLPTPPAPSDARRFFVAPDVVLMQPRGKSAWYNLAIGSGDGDDVHAANVLNRFYSLRDRQPFATRSQADYDSVAPLLDADLTDITVSASSIPDESPGWKMDLISADAASGEAVLAESITANGTVMFTTHTPGASAIGSVCATDGSNRVYAIRIDTGAAALDLNDDAKVTDADRSAELEQKGIPPGVRIELSQPPGQGTPPDTPPPASPAPPGTPGSPPASSRAPRCLVGTELLNRCVPLDTVLRTFWKRKLVD
jgi:type IV pilus assembly protein PilY1